MRRKPCTPATCGSRCRDAAFYPVPLVKPMLKGISVTADADVQRITFKEEQSDLINSISNSAGRIPTEADEKIKMSSIKKVTGGVLPIAYHSNQFKACYTDEYTSEVLNNFLIPAAIMEELDYVNDRMWEVSTRDDMMKVDGHIFVRSRCVHCNKGDALNPDIRARLVACEINKGHKKNSFVASAPRPPPLEAKKLLFAQYARSGQEKASH